jgi:hypothetical protein
MFVLDPLATAEKPAGAADAEGGISASVGRVAPVASIRLAATMFIGAYR